MKMKKAMKGFVRLLLAIVVIMGMTMVVNNVEVKAADTTITIKNSTDGSLTYTVSGNNLKKIDITLGNRKVISATNDAADTNKALCTTGSHTITKADILKYVKDNNGEATANSGVFASGNFSITATDANDKSVTGTGTATATNIYTVKLSISQLTGQTITASVLATPSDTSQRVTGKNIWYCYENTTYKITPTFSTTKVGIKYASTNGDPTFANAYGNSNVEFKVDKSYGSAVVTLRDGFELALTSNPTDTSVKSNTSVTFTVNVEKPSYASGLTYAWYVDGTKQSATTKSFSKKYAKGNYIVTAKVTYNGVTEEISGSVYADDEPKGTTIPSPLVITIEESIYFNVTGDEDTFDPDDKGALTDALRAGLDGNENDSGNDVYIDSKNSKCTAISSKGNTATFFLKALTYENTTDKLTLTLEDYDSNEAKIRVYLKPKIDTSKTVKTGSNPTVTFTLPARVGTEKTNNMTVSGYKVCIIDNSDSSKILAKSDVVNTTSATNTIKLTDYASLIQSVATGDTSFQFKVAILPCGKINGSGDVVEAKNSNDSLMISNADGSFTVYKLNLSADSGVTVVPTNSRYWGFDGESIEIKATGNIGYWEQNGSKITGTEGKTSYTHKFSSSTDTNKIKVVSTAGAAAKDSAAAGGADADANGKDKVPKTAESNAPIFLIIILVFAAMGGGYALYLQLKPATAGNNSSDEEKY